MIMHIRNTVILSFETLAQIERKSVINAFFFFFAHRKFFIRSHGNNTFVSLLWKFL